MASSALYTICTHLRLLSVVWAASLAAATYNCKQTDPRGGGGLTTRRTDVSSSCSPLSLSHPSSSSPNSLRFPRPRRSSHPMTHRRVEACDSWRPPPAPAQAPALLLRAGGPWARSSSPPGAFASLSVRDGGEAMVAKAEEEREVAAEGSGRKGKVPPVAQLLKHPLALLALVPSSVALFAAGAGAGAVAKTVTAPLDRVKILMQTHSVRVAGESTKKGIQFLEAMAEIGKEEGLKGYWKGNLPQVIRIIPYSAVQLFSYEVYKKVFRRKDGELSVFGRLAAGACAGMTSTLVTYPLDVLRLRLAVQSGHGTMSQVALNMLREEGLASFYGGLGPSLIGIAPYIAVNFCVFDLMKKSVPEKYKSRPETSLATALLSATFATLMCYPLDTVRRQMQMKGTPYNTIFDAIPGIVERGGLVGLYRGFVPNALKNLPNSSIKLTAFDTMKILISTGQKELEKLTQENQEKTS